jgi:exodeoxyribonuclease VII large subunit
MQQEIGLYELNRRIKGVLNNSFSQPVKVVAEISELNENRNGHCYLMLVEKSEEDDRIKAQARATIWSYTYRMLKPFFETTTGRRLGVGLKVLLTVEIVFHELYGYSLNIKDIDPSYTLGDIERRRREIIKKLEADGIIHMNKELEFPIHPKNIAVISSATAAGYGDFIDQLENNPYRFKFTHKLFSAIMQGERAEDSIIDALGRIYEYEDIFDIVVIIRGGGAAADLNCFDTYDLASNIAQFPIPVVSGIGHERDITIVDHVANTRVKTPTAAAEFIISKTNEFAEFILDFENDFLYSVEKLLGDNKAIIKQLFAGFSPVVKSILKQNSHKLNILAGKINTSSVIYTRQQQSDLEEKLRRLRKSISLNINNYKAELNEVPGDLDKVVNNKLEKDTNKIQKYTSIVKLADPVNILKKGYSLSYVDGKLVKSVKEISKDQIMFTKFSDGEVSSTVKEIISKKDK